MSSACLISMGLVSQYTYEVGISDKFMLRKAEELGGCDLMFLEISICQPSKAGCPDLERKLTELLQVLLKGLCRTSVKYFLPSGQFCRMFLFALRFHMTILY